MVSKLIRVICFFSPEILLLFMANVFSQWTVDAMLEISGYAFCSYAECNFSNQFLLTFFLLGYCLIAHSLRFLIFRILGNSLLKDYIPSNNEAMISLVIVVAYSMFLINAMNVPGNLVQIEINTFDVIGASTAALSFFVIAMFVFSVFHKEK